MITAALARQSSSPTVDDTLSSALALRDAGFAIHWLRAKSKAPAGGEGWSDALVATAEQLRATYQSGYNVGLRTGEPSKVAGMFAHVFDVDVRIADLADEAWAEFDRLLPGIRAALPSVVSGSGGESRHLHFISDRAFQGRKLAVSEGKHRDAAGKWHYDWEIDLFGTGRQVAMPPSIHPDTGLPYRWEREWDLDGFDQPIIRSEVIDSLGVAETGTFAFESRPPLDFKPGQLEADLDVLPVSIWDDRHQWIAIGQALHHQFGGSQEGFDLWMHYSAKSESHLVDSSLRAELRRYRQFGRNRRQPVTMGTVRQWAQDARAAALYEELDDLDAGPDEFDDLIAAPVHTALPTAANDDEAVFSIGLDTQLDWKSLLAITEAGEIKSNLHNLQLILANDRRTASVMAFNEFSRDVVQRGRPGKRSPARPDQANPVIQLEGPIWRLRDQQNGDFWSEDKDDALRAMIEAPKTQGGYGMKVSDRDLHAAVSIVARKNCFHPVREYLSELTWDGTPRAERLFIDYLGAPDDAYTRSVGRLMLTAAVARVFEPGCKFDTAVILQGLQGKRKSTFISTLAKSWFAELEGDISDAKVMVEAMQKAWILEMPELGGFVRGDVRHVKAFISRRTDKVRLAYARRAGEFDRQCIFIGSTNDDKYLKDDTGNRRFWPIVCAVESIDTDRLAREVDQIWAEALVMYQAMRAQQSHGTLPLYLTDAAAQQIAVQLQESARVENADEVIAGQIATWIETPVTSGNVDDDLDADGRPVLRNEVCGLQIWVECLKRDAASFSAHWPQVIGRAIRLVPGWHDPGKRVRIKPWGQQRIYWRDGYSGKASELI